MRSIVPEIEIRSRKELINNRYLVSSYNENTEEELEYYINKRNHYAGDTAWMWVKENDEIVKLKILHIIEYKDDPFVYNQLIKNDDILIDGEEEFEADTSCEFIEDDDNFLVWFEIVKES